MDLTVYLLMYIGSSCVFANSKLKENRGKGLDACLDYIM